MRNASGKVWDSRLDDDKKGTLTIALVASVDIGELIERGLLACSLCTPRCTSYRNVEDSKVSKVGKRESHVFGAFGGGEYQTYSCTFGLLAPDRAFDDLFVG